MKFRSKSVILLVQNYKTQNLIKKFKVSQSDVSQSDVIFKPQKPNLAINLTFDDFKLWCRFWRQQNNEGVTFLFSGISFKGPLMFLYPW